MHKKNLALTSALSITCFFIFSCTKSNSEPSPVNVTPQPITYIFSFGDDNNQPDTIQFANDSTKIKFVQRNPGGDMRVEFAGKNGAGILGDPKVLYSGRMTWHMKDDDTIRIYEKNQLIHLLITKKSSATNFSGISMQTGRQEILSEAEERINGYFKNTIKAEKFSSW
jgi:hypothetical protein